jgi:hypothetical protein
MIALVLTLIAPPPRFGDDEARQSLCSIARAGQWATVSVAA